MSCSRVNLRGACGLAWSFWATAMMNSRCTSRPSLSRGLPGSITAVGKGWRGGMNFTIAGLSDAGGGTTVWGVMMGLRMYSCIDVMINCLNCVPSVALKGAAFNPSWHLTAVGASVPLSRFTSRVGGGSAFFVRRIMRHISKPVFAKVQFEHVLFDVDVDDSAAPESFDTEPFFPKSGRDIGLFVPVGV